MKYTRRTINEEKAEELKKSILEEVFADKMAPFYEHLCGKYDWVVDEKR